MELNLSKRLAFLANGPSDLSSPFDQPPVEEPIIAIPTEDVVETEEARKRRYVEMFDDFDNTPPTAQEKTPKLNRRQEMIKSVKDLDEFAQEALADEFDQYLESGDFLTEEDTDFRNSLIGLGRQYARETATTAEASEITKAFSGSEQKLTRLFDEIGKDKELIGKDIDNMRKQRSRNFDALASLISSRTQYHNSQLSVIKEVDNIKKTQFDLLAKESARKKETDAAAAGGITPNTIRDLFGSLGRKDLIDSVGGYASLSGNDTDDTMVSLPMDDAALASKYGVTSEEEDGSKFLAYEGLGVHYILLVDSDNEPQDIIAEDSDGNIVPDYPIPRGDVKDRKFQINRNNMNAEDDYHRQYQLRYI